LILESSGSESDWRLGRRRLHWFRTWRGPVSWSQLRGLHLLSSHVIIVMLLILLNDVIILQDHWRGGQLRMKRGLGGVEGVVPRKLIKMRIIS